MTSYEPSKILRELNNLISYSCSFSEEQASMAESMHTALIKKFFGAHKVSFDKKNDVVNVQIPISETEYTHLTLECQDMEKFLKSCVEKDSTSLSFYQNMLIYYNVEKKVA